MVRFRIWDRDGSVCAEGQRDDFDNALRHVESLLENENPNPADTTKIQIERMG
jgi:hypothetical protein